MNIPDAKALKKLAAACRKAGIKTYKHDGLELTFTDEEPYTPKASKRNVVQTTTAPDSAFESDTLTEEQLLMWSAGNPSEDATEGTDS